jgi:hypothetical protein
MCIVAPAVVSSIAQPTPQLSMVKSSSPSTLVVKEELKSSSLNISAGVTNDNKQTPVDTIRISSQALQSSTDFKKDEAKKIEAKKEAAGDANKNVSPESTTSKVLFVYDQKGELITKYMDSGNNLIYQVPSELMLFSKEADSKSNSSVDTKA